MKGKRLSPEAMWAIGHQHALEHVRHPKFGLLLDYFARLESEGPQPAATVAFIHGFNAGLAQVLP